MDAKRHENRQKTEHRRSLALLLHYLLRPFGYLEFTDLYKIELTDLPPLFEVPGYSIQRATNDDMLQLAREIRDDKPAVYSDLWKQGHHCFIAKHNGHIVAYDWIAFSSVQEEEYRFIPRSDDAICLNAYTAPEHRGRGLHSLLLLTMLHFAASRGKSIIYTAASLYNIKAWKSHLRMGWQRDFTLCWFRPYFTLRRRPWLLSAERYPVQVDWGSHSWRLAEQH